MTYKNTFISLMIVLIFGLATWSTLYFYHPQHAPTITNTQLPDAFMEDIVAMIFNKQGKLSLKIVTPKMIHYTKNDTTELVSPQLTFYRKSPHPWYITSKYAKSIQGIDKVDLWENVIIHHPADKYNPTTLIKTATLTVHPNEETADTLDLITLIQPNLIVNSIGMHADMNTGVIKLFSQVRGEYVASN